MSTLEAKRRAAAAKKPLLAAIPADTEAEALAMPEPDWPAPLAEEAFHGLAGDFVRAIEPHTEADPVALLVSLLIALGSIVGRTAYAVADGSRHYCNQFAVIVGQSSKARKGTSWNRVNEILSVAAEDWASRRVLSGLSSGEGLIYNVRDASEDAEGEVTDPGEPDKRLLIVESEYANVLKQLERQGNTLSTIVRDAWDKSRLSPLTKNNRIVATDPHISIIGHITREEVTRYLSATEVANGFGNRHLWFLTKRSKLLPFGGILETHEVDRLIDRVGEVIRHIDGAGRMLFDAEARSLWIEVYPELSRDRHGLAGSMTARAEAHVWRLSLMYAVLDCARSIGVPHLAAALALWAYAEESVRHIFGDATGNPLADALLRLIRSSPQGISRTDMSGFLGRNVPAAQIGHALGLLLQLKLVRFETVPGERGGRPREIWFAIRRTSRG
ncbi:MAG: DUF3987 domain-containing protein [Gemmataceae bacterium]